MPGLGGEFFGSLKILEDGVPSECKIQLHRIEDLHDNHFILLMAEVAEGAQDLSWGVEEVAQDNDKAATADPVGNLMEGVCRSCLTSGVEQLKLSQNRPEVRFCGMRRHIGADTLIIHGEPDGVPLLDHELGKCGGNIGGILKF